jgi:flagellar biosynthesis/type III secretory pathway M-ring protein FliF/YscJ
VAAAVGFQEERGDRVVVESLPFEATLSWQPKPADPPGGGTFFKDSSGKWNIGALAGAAVAVAALLAAVALLASRSRRVVVTATVEAPAAVGAGGPGGERSDVPALSGADAPAASDDGGAGEPGQPSGGAYGPPSDEVRALANALGVQDDSSGRIEMQLAAELAKKLKLPPEQEQELLATLTANVRQPSAATKKAEVLSKHMFEVAKRSPEAVAQIMQTWIADGEG